MTIKFEKMPDCQYNRYITGYIVNYDGVEIGKVYKKQGFSYRGTNGWNSGIRLQDFHPIEWRYREPNSSRDHWARSRKSAGESLLDAWKGGKRI